VLRGSMEIWEIRCIVRLCLDLVGYEISFPCVLILILSEMNFLRATRNFYTHFNASLPCMLGLPNTPLPSDFQTTE
jgi:hypothetical protein